MVEVDWTGLHGLGVRMWHFCATTFAINGAYYVGIQGIQAVRHLAVRQLAI